MKKLAGRLTLSQIRRLIGDAGTIRLAPHQQAMLAQLRHGVGREPGSLPEIWAATLDNIPESVEGVARTRLEWAVHVAVTHFALHQQSQSRQMHDQGRTFGAAIRSLAQQSGTDVHETPVYRRFVNLASSNQLSAVLVHARALITQLRGAGIGFNYARFAEDLYELQQPDRASGVRRGWGRDFHRTNQNDTSTSQLNTEGESR